MMCLAIPGKIESITIDSITLESNECNDSMDGLNNESILKEQISSVDSNQVLTTLTMPSSNPIGGLSSGNFTSAMIRFGGIVRKCNLTYLPDAKVGDYVIVHAGFAISKVQEEDAKYVFEFLSQLPDHQNK